MADNYVYKIMRTDDNGLQFEVVRDLTKDEANRWYINFMQMQSMVYPHKQTYEIVFQGIREYMPTVMTVGELDGWRLWAVHADGQLFSMTREYLWENGGAHGDPDNDLGGVNVGVYSFNSRERAIQEFKNAHGNVAVGRIKMKGVVIEHKHGYRAEYAKIVEIVGVKGEHRPNKKLYKSVMNIDPELPTIPKGRTRWKSSDFWILVASGFWGLLVASLAITFVIQLLILAAHKGG